MPMNAVVLGLTPRLEQRAPFHDPVLAPDLETTTLAPSTHDWRIEVVTRTVLTSTKGEK